jgi:glycosyltransferase involved in cell wall biosynthesis
MTTPTLVTIVVPAYNNIEYLAECLDSIVAQTMTEWEAIVVDDGSTRGDAAAVVRATADARVRLIRHDCNRGLAAARNTGIRAGRCEYVLPVDSDDRLAPTYLQTVLDAIGDAGAYDAAFTEFMTFGAWSVRVPYAVRDVEALLTEQWIPGPGTLFRRDLWERIGGYCEADALRPGNEDWDFWLGAVEQGLRITHLPQPLYLYRQHATSMMHGLRYHDYATREFMYKRHRALFDRYEMRNLFLSRGYLLSAKAHWRKSEPLGAVRLAIKSFRLAPSDFLASIADTTNRWLQRRRTGVQPTGEAA